MMKTMKTLWGTALFLLMANGAWGGEFLVSEMGPSQAALPPPPPPGSCAGATWTGTGTSVGQDLVTPEFLGHGRNCTAHLTCDNGDGAADLDLFLDQQTSDFFGTSWSAIAGSTSPSCTETVSTIAPAGATMRWRVNVFALPNGSQPFTLCTTCCATHADCDDGLFCNGAETCDDGLCHAGPAPNCDDGVSCTVDACNEATDSCDRTPDDALCDDGLFCNGAETCELAEGCHPGSSPCLAEQRCFEECDGCLDRGQGAPLDFNTLKLASYSQENVTDGMDVLDEGATLHLSGNTWKRTRKPFHLSDDTRIEFDFASGLQGEVHAVGFDENDDLSDNLNGDARHVQFWGSESDPAVNGTLPLDPMYGTPYSGSGDFEPFSIPVGEHFTGDMSLVFANDDDASAAAEGRYRCVRVFNECAVDVPVAPPRSCASDRTYREVRTVDEDFENGAVGWTNDAASTCSTGDYVLGNPTQQIDGGVITQVGGSQSGVNSVFTATNTSAGVDDVDDGNCILSSPTWSVPTASTLSVAYWHGQRDSGDDPTADDFFSLEYSTNGGGTWNILVSIGDVTSNAAWATATAAIPAGSNVKIRLQCSDGNGAGDLVECGIDDVIIFHTESSTCSDGLPCTPDCPCVAPTDADVLWRRIALKDEGEKTCPKVAGWHEELLFAHPDYPIPPPSLADFCLYLLEDESKINAFSSPKLKCHHPTRMALRRASGPPSADTTRSIQEKLAARFLEGAGGIVDAGTRWASPNVRLALLDTAPTMGRNPACLLVDEGLEDDCVFPPDSRPPSLHAPMLGAMANKLLCGNSSPCEAPVSSQLALPFKFLSNEFPPLPQPVVRTDQEGYMGTACDLKTIWDEAVERGLDPDPEFRDPEDLKGLILNLSLAWDPIFFEGDEALVEGMSLETRAVYNALQEVVSRGALVIAATGNKTDNTDPAATGAMLPAAWENHAVENPPPSGSGYQPLLYAVAGIDADGRLLGNLRPASTPPLVAYADHAVVDVGQGTGAPSETLTGSSVAALVVSAAAAAVWNHKPDLTAAEVMDWVYESAKLPSGSTLESDFCLAFTPEDDDCPTRQEARPVSVCKALQYACTQVDPYDTACVSCASDPLGNPTLPTDCIGSVGPMDNDFCSPGEAHRGITGEAWTFPQPTASLCPNCIAEPKETESIVNVYDVYVEIQNPFEDLEGIYSFTDLTLKFCGQELAIETPQPVMHGTSFTVPNVICSGAHPEPVDPELSAVVIDQAQRQRSVSAPVHVLDREQQP